jgi:hypothetical protein
MPSYFDQLAAGYAPIAGGNAPQYHYGFEGIPGMSSNPLVAILAQPFLAEQMWNAGMTPMGLGHDINAYDIGRHRQFMNQQQQAMTMASARDRETFMRTMQGMSALAGRPFGSKQRRMAGVFGDILQTASPTLAMVAPDFLDQMGGMRGSAAVMASRFMQGGRYQVDPLSGQLGITPQTAASMSEQMFHEFYETPEGRTASRGFRAGQMGSMYQELVSRGLVGRESGSREQLGRRALGTMRENEVAAAAGRQGVTMPAGGAAALRAEDIDKLTLDDSVAQRIRNFDVTRVTQAIRGYAGAVAAVRDIFGDAGRPNAPMSELMRGLEAMTNGSLSQMDPARASMMVRQTYNLSRMTGVSMDNAMALQEHASSRAQAMGLEPVFGIHANQGSMAWGGVYRGLGLGSHTAWGASNSDQLQQQDTNLRLGGAGSRMANRLAVLMRMRDNVGGFQEGSEAAELASAIESGATTFRGRSIGSITNRQLTGILTGARRADGASVGLGASDVNAMLQQESVNREFVSRYGLGDLSRQLQGPHQVQPFLANRLRETMTRRLMDRGVSREDAERAMQQVGGRATDRIMGLSAETFASDQSRNEAMGDILGEELRTAGMGNVLDRMNPRDREQFLRTSGSMWYGRANVATQQRFRMSLQDAHRLFDPRVQGLANSTRQNAIFEGTMQDIMTPLGRGSVMSRAFEAFQNAREGDNPAQVIASALGGVRTEDINEGMVTGFRTLQERMTALRAAQARVNALPAGSAERRAAQRDLDAANNSARQSAQSLAAMGHDQGWLNPNNLNARNTRDAVATMNAVEEQRTDLAGIRSGLGTNPTAAQRATPLRPSQTLVDSTLAEIRRSDPNATEDQARNLATMRLRAQRWGITDAEITSARGGGGGRSESAAIDHVITERQRAEFDSGTPEERLARHRTRNERFGRFWRSEDGARFRHNVEEMQDRTQTIAEQLVNSPEMVRRFGSQASDWHDELINIQQRRRALALRYAGNDVNRLIAGQLNVDNYAEQQDVMNQVGTLTSRQNEILRGIHGTHGRTGRQFRSDADEARRLLNLAPGATGANVDERARLVGIARRLTGPDERLLRGRREGETVQQFSARLTPDVVARLLRDTGAASMDELLSTIPNVIEPQLAMADRSRAASNRSGQELLGSLATAFGVTGFNAQDAANQPLAQRIGSSRDARGWAQYLGWSQGTIASAANALGGDASTRQQRLAQRYRDAMAIADPAAREAAMRSLQGDLHIDTGTAGGQTRWNRVTEALDFQRRVGLLDRQASGQSIGMTELNRTFERLLQNSNERPPGVPGGPGTQRIEGTLRITGLNQGDLNATTGGNPDAATAAP